MKLADQWRAIEARLPDDWAAVRLDVVVETAADRPRAAALLGPLNPGGVGEALRLDVRRRGGAAGPESLRRLLGRLDRERIWCELRLVDTSAEAVAAATTAEPEEAGSLAAGWDALLATLPPDWSDLLCELRLRSTDYLDRGALLCAPINPTRAAGAAFTFRAARRFGYGASPEMVRRCLERCDAERIRGEVAALRVLSDTHNVATQGPVWRVGGRTV